MIRASKHRSRRPPYGGFTLVEMLASLALVAIVLPVAMEGISLATSTAGLARQQLEAANLAQTKLAELLATGAWQTGVLSGDFGEDRPAYRWTGQVTEYEGTTLQQLDVRVGWTTRGMDYSMRLATLVYTGGQ